MGQKYVKPTSNISRGASYCLRRSKFFPRYLLPRLFASTAFVIPAFCLSSPSLLRVSALRGL